MNRKILVVAAFLGVTAIILGAFGAHGLRKIVDSESVASFEVGVRYQMYHALFLLFIGNSSLSETQKQYIFGITLIGILLFSGSIYGLATNEWSYFFDFKKIALLTPVGGLLLIIAWTLTIILFFRQKK
ncbi:DUF423 domain-containing protein [Capnocytophaga catalasegens]|uniref:Membrane protein n=1 Tax=Capnocytophaga catalasegens TaxID=1004260 RepID=A0AAV5AVZ2_9FLAO|nr:DUF423 domain-containing protein [Capnocytophaga catalasegens]GIZ15611.1 membrane protein [Capnocytophaga catalasegens]GJM49506.1 membrane protein [Capnocytophaga catalasegens]GJM51785.1 membrane protein [Capnocytophaga catalasegens]